MSLLASVGYIRPFLKEEGRGEEVERQRGPERSRRRETGERGKGRRGKGRRGKGSKGKGGEEKGEREE